MYRNQLIIQKNLPDFPVAKKKTCRDGILTPWVNFYCIFYIFCEIVPKMVIIPIAHYKVGVTQPLFASCILTTFDAYDKYLELPISKSIFRM